MLLIENGVNSSIKNTVLLFHCPVANGCAAGFFSIFD